MKMSSKALAVCFLGVSMASCKGIAPEVLNGEWNAVTIQGEAITPSDNAPYIGFETSEGRLYGFNGCNQIMGSLDVQAWKKGKVDFSGMAATMMACPDSKYEQLFTKATSEAKKATLEGEHILLKDASGQVVMELAKRTFTASQLDGEWNLVQMRGESITPSDETPFIGFKAAEKQVYGFTGCNRMTGSADLDMIVAGKPDFTKLGTTRMACADDKYETKFLQALHEATKVKMGYTSFSLLNDEGHVLLVFEKRK